MLILNGLESTLLSLLAQNPNLPTADAQKVLAALDSEAKLIGQAILWKQRSTLGVFPEDDEIERGAQAFIEWARAI